MKTLEIKLSPSSCDKAVKELAKRDFNQNHKIDELIARLAEIGLSEAQLRFQMGAHSGNENYAVAIEPIENGYKIVASGQDIYFIEFGTGDAAGEHPMGDRVSVGTFPGDWSETHARQYYDYGSWFYDGIQYHETPAEMPMYWAIQVMRENLQRIMGEVLDK